MIVIAIIAILAGIMVPNFMAAKAEAQLAACRQNIMNIVEALEMATTRCSYSELVHKLRSGGIEGGSASTGVVNEYLLENGYLVSLPRCPMASIPESSYGGYYLEYVYSANFRNYGGGIRVGCAVGKGNSSQGHTIGNKRIKPYYYLGGGNTSAPTETHPDGSAGCGWGDYVYDL